MPMPKVFPTTSLNPALRMHESSDTPDFWFYHKANYPTDCPAYYKQLIDAAGSHIEIWDPFFNVPPDSDDQNIFADIKDGLTIKILTMKKLVPLVPYLANAENAMKTIIPPAKNARFGLRVINRNDVTNQGGRFFHDRFLIIDQNNVFLVGSSVGYHVRSKMSTGIFKVTNSETIQFIRTLFDHYWNASSHHEIPIRFLHT